MNTTMRALCLCAGLTTIAGCYTAKTRPRNHMAGEKSPEAIAKMGYELPKKAVDNTPENPTMLQAPAAMASMQSNASAAPAAAPAASTSAAAAPAGPKSATPVTDALKAGDTSAMNARIELNVGGIMKSLDIGDPGKAERVRKILADHYLQLWAWHETADANITPLWAEWAEARSTGNKDEAKAEQVVLKIRKAYVGFEPEHQSFLKKLGEELTPEQVDVVKDGMTRSPGMKRTYDAYLQIVPALNDEQKKYLHDELAAAREDAMHSHADKEKINWFKVHKVKCQAYITAAGYDWDTYYKAFANKLKAAAPPKAAPAEPAKP